METTILYLAKSSGMNEDSNKFSFALSGVSKAAGIREGLPS